MLIAANKVKEIATGLTKDQFKTSALYQSAIIRELQVIGGAARQMSSETKSENTQINWSELSGMRNRLVHEYFRVDIDLIWDAVQNNVEPLIDSLKPVIPPDEE